MDRKYKDVLFNFLFVCLQIQPFAADSELINELHHLLLSEHGLQGDPPVQVQQDHPESEQGKHPVFYNIKKPG
jgi:hypothetical protein